MDKKIIRILGSLLLCFMFFGTYLDARGRRGGGRRGFRRSGVWHRRPYYGRRHWYGWDWGWGPAIWFSIAASRSTAPKEDPLKKEKDRANNAITNYETILDSLQASVESLQRGMSYYTAPAAIQHLYNETNRMIIDYFHTLDMLDLKLDLLTNRVNAATNSEKAVQRTLDDVVTTAQRHGGRIDILNREITPLTQDISSPQMKDERFVQQTFKRIQSVIRYHTGEISQLTREIQGLINRL